MSSAPEVKAKAMDDEAISWIRRDAAEHPDSLVARLIATYDETRAQLAESTRKQINAAEEMVVMMRDLADAQARLTVVEGLLGEALEALCLLDVVGPGKRCKSCGYHVTEVGHCYKDCAFELIRPLTRRIRDTGVEPLAPRPEPAKGELNDAEHRRQYPQGCGSRGRCLICHPIESAKGDP